jgi:hypothetical protein
MIREFINDILALAVSIIILFAFMIPIGFLFGKKSNSQQKK